jgi:hypothetical protein
VPLVQGDVLLTSGQILSTLEHLAEHGCLRYVANDAPPTPPPPTAAIQPQHVRQLFTVDRKAVIKPLDGNHIVFWPWTEEKQGSTPSTSEPTLTSFLNNTLRISTKPHPHRLTEYVNIRWAADHEHIQQRHDMPPGQHTDRRRITGELHRAIALTHGRFMEWRDWKLVPHYALPTHDKTTHKLVNAVLKLQGVHTKERMTEAMARTTGWVASHLCGRKGCINPQHLRLATDKIDTVFRHLHRDLELPQ